MQVFDQSSACRWEQFRALAFVLEIICEEMFSRNMLLYQQELMFFDRCSAGK
jgi:hypothetical protein